MLPGATVTTRSKLAPLIEPTAEKRICSGSPEFGPTPPRLFEVREELKKSRSMAPARQVAPGEGGVEGGGGVFYYAASTTERDGMVEFIAAMGEAGFTLASRAVAPPVFHTNPLHEATQTKCDLHFAGLKEKSFELYEWRRA